MSLAVVSDLTKYYGAELIFRGVSFRVEAKDRIGLVGPNGAGKTTLLRLLADRLEPDAGTVSLESGVRVGYLPQVAEFVPERSLYAEMLASLDAVRALEDEMAELAARLGDQGVLAQPDEYAATLERYAEVQARFEHAGGYTLEQRVQQILDGLGFSREQQAAPAGVLSGGQQTRAALGKLLLQEPDLLLLDEPTNHLDLAALEWLEGYLTAWHGAVVVVSHDRYFLDRVTTRTVDIAHQHAELYPGNYTRYTQLRAERFERWAKEYDEQQEYIARTEEFIRRYKAGQRAKEARGRQTKLDRMERIERPPESEALAFRLGAQVESGQVVLTTDRFVAGYPVGPSGSREGGVRVVVPDTIVVRGDRVGLIGPNGGGKTTLLRTLVGQLPALAGRAALGHNVQVGYYAQTHEGLNPRAVILDEIRAASHLSEEGARTYLGRFLFTGDDVFKTVGTLSGGERSRMALAKLTLQGANFLVLDEPTNHLDLPARQALESVLASYDGTMIFVSHDRYFVDALATKLWVLDDGAITVHEGNYTTYRRRATVAASATAPTLADSGKNGNDTRRDNVAPSPSGEGGGRGRNPNRGKNGKGETPEVRSLERVEAEIAAQESRVAALEAELGQASAAADVTRIAELGAAYDTAKARLDDLYGAWEDLAS